MTATFFVVQPFRDGPDRYRLATVISEHETAEQAFAELERLAERLDASHVPPDALEFVVVDQRRRPVHRGH